MGKSDSDLRHVLLQIKKMSMLFPALVEQSLSPDVEDGQWVVDRLAEAMTAGTIQLNEAVTLLLRLRSMRAPLSPYAVATVLTRVSNLVVQHGNRARDTGQWVTFDRGMEGPVATLVSVVDGLVGDPFIAVNETVFGIGWVTYPDLLPIANGSWQYLLMRVENEKS